MFNLSYDEPVFRPPSEARSLILQVTVGCSWNQCAFCEMYTGKNFKVRPEEVVFGEIDRISERAGNEIRKVFIADGNPMVLSFGKWERLLDKLDQAFPRLNRISTYALASDLDQKTFEQLVHLREKGLKLLYVGIETGDQELLRMVNKSEENQQTLENLKKARSAGIKLSVMILNGLGGRDHTDQHARNSAKLINEIQPEYLSTLVLSYPLGLEHFLSRFKGSFVPMSPMELIRELHQFISQLELENTVYRSDHASNYLSLRGTLSRDKVALLARLEEVLRSGDESGLRPEWLRGL